MDKKQSSENPQDDINQTPKTSSGKELYICCHIRRVEMGSEDNEDSKNLSESKKAASTQNKVTVNKSNMYNIASSTSR